MRLPLAILTVSLIASTLSAQTSSVYSRAMPPDPRALERVNLTSNWTTYLPMSGRTDYISHVQSVEGRQIYVQLASGVLIAIDATTGVQQWRYTYPTPFVSQYPIAVNDKYVFALNVTRLYCFQRYTGLLEFDYEVQSPNIMAGSADGALPTTGPVVDDSYVYLVLNGRSVLSYRLPDSLRPVVLSEAESKRRALTLEQRIAARYAASSIPVPSTTETFQDFRAASPIFTDLGVSSSQKTPSLSTLPFITPPYTLTRRALRSTPSLSVLPNLQQPYTLRPTYLKYNQQTPSLSVIPPSVARAQELSNMRVKPIGPTPAWPNTYIMPDRVRFTPTLTRTKPPIDISRIWLTTESETIVAVAAANGAQRVNAPLQSPLVSPLAGPFAVGNDLLGFGCLRDGTVVAIDLQQGLRDQVRILWRSPVGGILDNAPIVTPDAIFVSGTGVGTTKLDIRNGDILWRTEFDADNVLSVNDDHVYVRDTTGKLRIYTQNLTRRSTSGTAIASGSIDLSEFAIPIHNPLTDRIFLAANNGILISLRDNANKYLQPVKIAGPSVVQPPPPPAKAPAADEPPAFR